MVAYSFSILILDYFAYVRNGGIIIRRISEYEDEEIVVIDGKWKLNGWVTEQKCYKCKEYLIYFDKYDSTFCLDCNSWRESKCSDSTCEFCSVRPKTPLYEFRNGKMEEE